jgi:hypothetical protein
MSVKIVSSKNKIWSIDKILLHSQGHGMITALAYDNEKKELFSVEEHCTGQKNSYLIRI